MQILGPFRENLIKGALIRIRPGDCCFQYKDVLRYREESVILNIFFFKIV